MPLRRRFASASTGRSIWPRARPADDQRQRTLRASIGSSYRLLSRLRAAGYCGRSRRSRVARTWPRSRRSPRGRRGGGRPTRRPPPARRRLTGGRGRDHRGATACCSRSGTFLLDELRERRRGGARPSAASSTAVWTMAEPRWEIGGRRDPTSREADRRLRAELDNLREPPATSRVPMAVTTSGSGSPSTSPMPPPSGTCESSGRGHWSSPPILRLARHPAPGSRSSGASADGARLLGDLDLATDPRRRSPSQLAGPRAGRSTRCITPGVARGSVAHFRGDFAAAREAWLRSGSGRPRRVGRIIWPRPLWPPPTAATEPTHGDLLDRAHAAIAGSGCRLARRVRVVRRGGAAGHGPGRGVGSLLRGGDRAGPPVRGRLRRRRRQRGPGLGPHPDRRRRRCRRGLRDVARLLAAHRPQHPALDHRAQRRGTAGLGRALADRRTAADLR